MNSWDSQPLWMIFDSPATVTRHESEDVSAWQVEKSANRLRRQVERMENRRFLPRVPWRIPGRVVKELREAHELLHEAGDVLQEAK